MESGKNLKRKKERKKVYKTKKIDDEKRRQKY